LPDGTENWTESFVNTTDAEDNGFWFRSEAGIDGEQTLFTTSMTDGSGRLITDPTRAVHLPRSAHFRVNDFDFTLITVHLPFAGGDTSESAKETRVVLDYLDEYFEQPGHDPDVIISGDFNIPSRLSGQTGSAGVVLDQIFDDDPRFQVGERRFVVTVHEPTLRRSVADGGTPANNYDHFVVSADVLEELVQARRVSTDVLTANADDPELRLTSDHFPVVAFFRTVGAGVQLDVGPTMMSVNAVVNGASFTSRISVGSWISIFEAELAPTTRLWRVDEIIAGVLPTKLDGVSVLVNGNPAAVSFISPGQLNVQAPDDEALGPVSVGRHPGWNRVL
jgi:exonuclease III